MRKRYIFISTILISLCISTVSSLFLYSFVKKNFCEIDYFNEQNEILKDELNLYKSKLDKLLEDYNSLSEQLIEDNIVNKEDIQNLKERIELLRSLISQVSEKINLLEQRLTIINLYDNFKKKHPTSSLTFEEFYVIYNKYVLDDFVSNNECELLGHVLVYYPEKPATYFSDGHNAYEECLKCDYTTYKIIPKLNNNLGHSDPEEYTFNKTITELPTHWNILNYGYSEEFIDYISTPFFSFDYKLDSNGYMVPGEYQVIYGAVSRVEDVTSNYIGNKYRISDGDSARIWKFTLRNDLKWENGDQIKAQDFVDTMHILLGTKLENSRADFYFSGDIIIHNAKNYYNQGNTINVSARKKYSDWEVAKEDSSLFFAASNASAFGQWVAKNYGSYVSSRGMAWTMSALTGGDTAKLDGKTWEEIKADPVLKAEWDKIIGWWKTDLNEELDMFVYSYTYPEMAKEEVGIYVGATPYELIVILDKALPLTNDDGSLSFQAAYNFSSLPLVHVEKFNELLIASNSVNAEWKSKYNTSVETTMSWGPYKLGDYKNGNSCKFVRNTEWFGYSLTENSNLYQADNIVYKYIPEWSAAWTNFLSGKIDDIGLDVSIADEYKGSARAYFTPDDFVASLQLQSDAAQLEARESDGIDKSILTNVKFRKALSLSINRQDFATKTTTSSKAGFGLFNSMHYYDAENGKVFRNEDVARQVLCDIYGVDASQFPSLEEAEASITGYDLELARQLLTEAYYETVEEGLMKETDKVEITFGSSVLNESVNRSHNYVKAAWEELAVGTPLEGRLVFSPDLEAGDKWADDFRAGKYDVCMGGWSGAAWDPGYFLLAYLSPDYMYSTAWDTSSVDMEFTMVGVAADGGDITDTMSLMDWYDCLNGATGAKYDFSANALEQSQRLQLIAALEKQVLQVYYSVPLYNKFGASLISYKLDYITYEYNTFMGYGGIKYATYNFSDAAWAAEVAAQGNELDYH